MERFIVFGGHCYYAAGGLHDFVGSFETIEEAVEAATATEKVHPYIDRQQDVYEWWHILDAATGKIAGRSIYQAHGAANADPTLT